MHNLFFPSQYAYRNDHSTEFAALELIEKIQSQLDNGNIFLAVYLALSKAFDLLDHSIILHKLARYGITGTPLLLF